jgi:hypothetical protein
MDRKLPYLSLLCSYVNSKPTCRYTIISGVHMERIRILIVFIDLEFTFRGWFSSIKSLHTVCFTKSFRCFLFSLLRRPFWIRVNRPISKLTHLARRVKFNPFFNRGLRITYLWTTQSNLGLKFNPRLSKFNPRLALIGFWTTGPRTFSVISSNKRNCSIRLSSGDIWICL